MPKNIVICCDGTSNEFDGDRTNVVKLYQMLAHDPARQLTYYHAGLGTLEAPGALTAWSRWWTRLAGFAFGYGLKNDIRDIYAFPKNGRAQDAMMNAPSVVSEKQLKELHIKILD